MKKLLVMIIVMVTIMAQGLFAEVYKLDKIEESTQKREAQFGYTDKGFSMEFLTLSSEDGKKFIIHAYSPSIDGVKCVAENYDVLTNGLQEISSQGYTMEDSLTLLSMIIGKHYKKEVTFEMIDQ